MYTNQTMYHATDASNVENILEDGLRGGRGVYLALSEEDASEWAYHLDIDELAILRVRVDWDAIEKDPESEFGEYPDGYVSPHVPPQHIEEMA